MAANHSSVKLSTEFLEEARREADVLHRSVGAQVEYWAKLGRAIENTPGFDVDTVKQAIEGRLRLDTLPDGEERARYLRRATAEFDEPDGVARTYFAQLGAREGAVGSDGKGGLVRRQPSARPKGDR